MRFVSVVLLALVGLSVQASTVYRCEKDGHVTFTDRACAGAAPYLVPYEASAPVVLAPPSNFERELARQYDQRLARNKSARDQADAKWLKDQKGLRDRAAAVRKAIIEHRVIVGMSTDEVKSALGEPDRVQKSETHGTDKETWTYLDNGARRTVNFKRGAVSTSSRREREEVR